jgi:hypothetical protein
MTLFASFLFDACTFIPLPLIFWIFFWDFALTYTHGGSGTHLSNTKEAEAFALVSEEGIAKGVRRVTALTMGAAKEAIHQSTVFSAQIDEASKLQGPALEKVGGYFSPSGVTK